MTAREKENKRYRGAPKPVADASVDPVVKKTKRGHDLAAIDAFVEAGRIQKVPSAVEMKEMGLPTSFAGDEQALAWLRERNVPVRRIHRAYNINGTRVNQGFVRFYAQQLSYSIAMGTGDESSSTKYAISSGGPHIARQEKDKTVRGGRAPHREKHRQGDV